MAATSIEWKRAGADGEKIRVHAERTDAHWTFRVRSKRFDRWQEVASPPLEDWLELLDGVRRRIGRGLLKDDEEKQLVRQIRKLFPDVELPR